MAFVFNIQIDATDPENPVIKDKNNYPLLDKIYILNNSTNSITGNVLTLTGYTLAGSDLEGAQMIRLNGEGYSNDFFAIKDVSQSGADTLITFYEDISGTVGSIEVAAVKWSTNGDDEIAISRNTWLMLCYVTHKPSAGDIDMPVDNSLPRTADQWAISFDDGGWIIISIYAVPRFDNLENGSANSYVENDVVFEIENDELKVYKSLVNSNTDALSETNSWEDITEDYRQSVVESSELESTGTVESYVANAFIDQKLTNMIDTINTKIDCSCLDVCEFPVNLKLSMYKEQIKSLIARKNWTKAQESYEKALDLAQNNL